MMALYRALFSFLFFAAFFLGLPFSRKMRRGFRLRRERLRSSFFGPQKKSFLVHAASGEYEYARPLISELKRTFPDIPVIVTFFSPTYVKSIDGDPLVDLAVPLPLDFPGAVKSFLKRTNPIAVFIARTDLWPEFLEQCKNKNIPRILFSYYENPRKGILAGWLRNQVLKKLSHVDCVDEATKALVEKKNLKIPITACGDTRFDRVQERKSHPKVLPFTMEREQTLVLGSTWKEDEEILLPALKETKKWWQHVIIAPHEPTPKHLQDLQNQLKKKGLSFQVFSETKDAVESDILIVDQVGWLFDLYRFGSLGFVGGSFKGSVHSVMEPLAFGLKVFLGPYMQNNGEAVAFRKVSFQGLSVVDVLKNSKEVARTIEAYFQKPPEQRRLLQSEIEQAVLDQSGASKKLIGLHRELFSTSGS